MMSENNATDDKAPPLLARLLFGTGLAVLGLRNVRDLDGRIAYADAKGVPLAGTLVPVASSLLIGGGLGISLWKSPKLSAASIATFFVGVTPTMHNFWAVDKDSRDEEFTSFLQNLALLGAALAFLKRAAKE